MKILSSQKIKKARSAHRCDFCYGVIRAGSSYDRSTIENDGSLYRWKSHLPCLELIKVLNMCGDDGVSSADFSEYVCCEYQSIVSKHHPERWKHELHHGTPNFRERLKFVLEHHKILEKEELIKLIDHGDQGFY